MNWLKYALASVTGFLAAVLFFAASAILIVWLTSIPSGGCGGPPCEAERMQIAWDLVALAGFVGVLIGTFVATMSSVAFYRKASPKG
jgi:hypothetical protein